MPDLLFYIFILIILIQIVFYGFIFMRFGLHKPELPKLKNIKISVLVCAKNEAENLKAFIPLILDQDYPEFELVLINDGSSDTSLDIMREFERNNKNVKVVDVKPLDSFWNNKKYPLTLGIKASKYDFLLFTDADCIPVSSHWIREMSRHFTNQKTIVLGFGNYRKIKGNLLNKLIRYETTVTAIQYFSFALMGSPYMGVGRNLAYRKDVFFNIGGFKDHMNVNSGDDDLFVNQVATPENTTISYSHESSTDSVPEKTFMSWFRQKRRHVSTASHYKTKHKITLGLLYITQLLFWIIGLTLVIYVYKSAIVLALILFRFVLVALSYGLGARKLKNLDTLILLPFLELFLVLSQLVIFITNLRSKNHSWR
ncbi:MAG: glycosyltransferase [Flavobacteriaceae bacterium]|nr:glycosyltransferase [Flavobacteriaceae bacterium]